MSVPPRRHLPERPSLEQLRKQAREHLDTLRAADPSVNLAAAQHALAREYGFESWPKLVHHVESMQPANRMLQPAELKSDQKLHVVARTRHRCVGADSGLCVRRSQAARALIAKDPSLARSHYDYRKPLYFAVRENHIDVARFLLEHDCNPLDLWMDDDPIEIARDRGYAEMEPLLTHSSTRSSTHRRKASRSRWRCGSRSETVARAARRAAGALSKGDKRSNQPIHWATMTRQLEMIDELLRRGADINAQRMDGARPIHVTNGDYFYRGWRDVPRTWPVTAGQVMAHLKARGAFIDLPTACHTGDMERVRELLRQDPSLVNRIGEHEGYYLGSGSPLSNAAAVGRMDIVQLLFDHGADPNLPEEQYAPKGKALYSAVYHGHYDIAKLLLERGAFPNPPVESSGDALWVSRNGAPTNAWSSCSFRTAPSRRRDTGEDWSTREHNWLRISPLHEAARKAT